VRLTNVLAVRCRGSADATSTLGRLRRSLAPLNRIALVSPTRQERAVLPSAQVLTSDDGTLTSVRPDLRFDLIVAPRVLDDTPNPTAAVRNLLASCRALLVGNRALDAGVGAVATWSPDRLIAETRSTGSTLDDRDALRLALLRGDLGAPLIRIDDYPTGVRPILEDLSPIHEILRAFDERGLPIALGIVPALLDRDMFAFLRTLRHLVPAVHGFDHCYFRFSPRLRRMGDPYNERGKISQFNEFRWQLRSTVERRLGEGKARLERELDRPVTIYIPPCNRVDAGTARVLRRVGFALCLCDGPVPGGFIPSRRSDFYGRSTEFGPATDAEVVTLHATWEWDLRRRGNTGALPRLVDLLAARVRDKRAAIDDLARDLSSAPVG
jgi:hypothetical protein